MGTPSLISGLRPIFTSYLEYCLSAQSAHITPLSGTFARPAGVVKTVGVSDSPLVYRLQANGKVGVSSWDATSKGVLTWVHLDGWNPIAIQGFLRQKEGVSNELAEDLSLFSPCLRFDHATGRAAAILPSVQEDTERPPIPFILIAHDDLIFTATKDPCSFLTDMMNEWVDDPEGIGMTPPELLKSLIHGLANGDTDQVDLIHDRIESLEDRIYEMKGFEASSAICIKREMLEQRRKLALIRDFIQAVTRHGDPWAPKAMMSEYQDINSLIYRQIESLDLARDILSSILDAQLGIVSYRLNEVMRVLTVISTLMMAGSLIAGIYGMNFANMPGLTHPYGFYICLASIALASGLILLIFKRKGFF
jgi:magnesium transporter